MRMSVEQFADATIPLHDNERRHVRSLVASMRTLAFGYCNRDGRYCVVSGMQPDRLIDRSCDYRTRWPRGLEGRFQATFVEWASPL